MSNSTTRKAKSKPDKPYDGFPLFPHASGQWAKKIKGKLFYFGVWGDPGAALERLNREYPYLLEGREPPCVDVSGGCTLKQLCNEFLRSKSSKMDAGELSPRTFSGYFHTADMLIGHFGKDRRVDDLRPDDFRILRSKLAERFNVTSLRNEVNRVRIVCNYAFANNLIDKPVSFGTNFDRPSAKAVRKNRNEGGKKMFTREEILRILEVCKPQMKAMVLLAVNAGFGNSDCASLPQKAVDLKTGWVEFPRPKTEISRRVPLWLETVTAVRDALAVRPKPLDASGRGLCFLTQQGRPWVRVRRKSDGGIVAIDSLSEEFTKIVRRLEINGRRRLGFYTFRHVFETQAGESRDQVGVDAIMGHVDASMAATYREGISDERLLAVVGVVHGWLFG